MSDQTFRSKNLRAHLNCYDMQDNYLRFEMLDREIIADRERHLLRPVELAISAEKDVNNDNDDIVDDNDKNHKNVNDVAGRFLSRVTMMRIICSFIRQQ